MNAPINIVILVLLTTGFAFANEDWYAKYDSITAEYCLNYGAHISFDTEKGWKLLHYEQFTPLAIKIQTKSYKYNYITSAYLGADIKFSTEPRLNAAGSTCIGTSSNSKKTFKCRVDRNEEYDIYDYFDTLYLYSGILYSDKIDTSKISVLFGKVFPIKWNLNFEIDNQPHNISGSYNIRISGLCTEKQLKKIEGDKK